jgi:hypothetical protein
VPPPALAELDRELKALRSDLEELAARLERSDSRIAGMESRVRDAESSMRRLASDVAPSAATRAVERSVAPPRDTARKPAPVAPLGPTPTPVTVADSERWIASDRSAPPSPPPPSELRPRAKAVESPRMESTTRIDEAPGPAARPVDDAPGPAARPVSDDASPTSAPPPTLRDRLRADWRTIKQGFATVGDDFKATVRDFTRKVTGERRTLQ